MKRYIIVFFALLSVVGFAQSQDTPGFSIESGTSRYSEYKELTRLTVQRVNTKKFFRPSDQASIGSYLACYQNKLSNENYRCLADAMPQLVGAGIIDARDGYGRIILNQSPSHYFGMWQTYLGVMNTNWYVDVPAPPASKPLPVFTPGVRQDRLVLDPVPGCGMFEQPQPICATPCQRPGALQVSKPGEYQETPVGYFYQQDSERCNPEDAPATCDPNGTPPDPPSVGAATGTGTGGQPAAPPSGGNQPPAQPTHNTGGASWDPSPSHPKVADPVKK